LKVETFPAMAGFCCCARRIGDWVWWRPWTRCCPIPGTPTLIEHKQVDLLRQRIFGLALGYEDLNDHDTLRKDLAWQTALGRSEELASDSTLCRLEQRVDRRAAMAFHQVLLEKFIASFAQAPTELILDFDATDDRVHGNQEGRHFHGYYGDWCFLPLYVFCGEQLLVSYLRPSNIDASRHAWAILKLLVKRLRQQWPQVKIIVRADSGFCRWKMLHWCEWASVDYIIGVAKNSRLEALSRPLMEKAKAAFASTADKQRVGLKGTELVRAQVETIRLKLLKIGTVIIRNTRRIRLLFSSAYPYQQLFKNVCAVFSSTCAINLRCPGARAPMGKGGAIPKSTQADAKNASKRSSAPKPTAPTPQISEIDRG
jgi:hypothetical protein